MNESSIVQTLKNFHCLGTSRIVGKPCQDCRCRRKPANQPTSLHHSPFLKHLLRTLPTITHYCTTTTTYLVLGSSSASFIKSTAYSGESLLATVIPHGMDPLRIAANIIAALQAIAKITDVTSRVLGRGAFRRYRLLYRNYGFIIAILLSITFPGTASRYERIENDILNGPAENAGTFRQAITDECNMTAVAVRPYSSRLGSPSPTIAETRRVQL